MHGEHSIHRSGTLGFVDRYRKVYVQQTHKEQGIGLGALTFIKGTATTILRNLLSFVNAMLEENC